MSFLNSILGKTSSPNSLAKKIQKHLVYLDQVELGLSKKAASYIATGDGRVVLATLASKQKDIADAFQKMRQTDWKKAHDLETQLDIFICSAAGYPELAARMAEINGLALPVYRHATAGADKVSAATRALLRSLGRLEKDDLKGIRTLDRRDLDLALEALDAPDADIFVFNYGGYSWSSPRFSPDGRTRFVFKKMQTASVDEVNNAFRRLPADGRARALDGYAKSEWRPEGDHQSLFVGFLADGSQKVRDAARAILITEPVEKLFPLVLEILDSSKATQRAAAVQMMGEIGTDEAFAALKERDGKEKAQSVKALIQQYLSIVPSQGSDDGSHPDNGYLAVDGTFVEIPEYSPLDQTKAEPFGSKDRKELQELEEQEYLRRLDEVERRKAAGWKNVRAAKRPKNADRLIDYMSGKTDTKLTYHNNRHYSPWIESALQRLPVRQALRASVGSAYTLVYLLEPYTQDPFTRWVGAGFANGLFDLRHVLEMSGEFETVQPGQNNTPMMDYLENHLTGSRWGRSIFSVPREAAWPLIADNLATVLSYLPPKSESARDNESALELLQLLPKLPGVAVQPVLFAAISASRGPSKLAQEMLIDIDGVDDTLTETLNDRRQAVRANVAKFLANRGNKSAVKQIATRLKKEKSELARGAMISAIAQLQGDIAPYLSKSVLTKEAKALAGKLRQDKFDWLDISQAPGLRWKSGGTCAPEVAEGWLKLAYKLKSPGESELFGLYLDQINPEDARAFSDWILKTWLAYDTYQKSRSEYFAGLVEQAKQWKKQWPKGYGNRTAEEIATDHLRYSPQPYENSAADAKGLLSLCIRGTPSVVATTTAAYLKNHGKRVSQAKSLVDMLAVSDSPEALQIVVATATRFKQRSVREHAEQLIVQVADRRGWTPDELADRSIPTGGLEDNGEMELPCGEDNKVYRVVLSSDLAFQVFNPEGKIVKALPAGKDENTKESKAILSAAKKTLKTVTKQQAVRLYEAMMSGRSWQLENWHADLNAHPIMNRLTERVVWRARDASGKDLATFRPTAEGDYLDADGDDVSLNGAETIEIAHGSQLGEPAQKAWLQHLEDFEISPLFDQLTRPVLKPSADQLEQTKITDREGWVLDALKLRSEATQLGYDKGQAEDGGWWYTFHKVFPSAGLTATIEFTGTGQEGESHPVALQSLRFGKSTDRWAQSPIKLSKVPELLLSECWNDFHALAAKGAHDPDWERNTAY